MGRFSNSLLQTVGRAKTCAVLAEAADTSPPHSWSLSHGVVLLGWDPVGAKVRFTVLDIRLTQKELSEVRFNLVLPTFLDEVSGPRLRRVHFQV